MTNRNAKHVKEAFISAADVESRIGGSRGPSGPRNARERAAPALRDRK
jgi:hypothetical protein